MEIDKITSIYAPLLSPGPLVLDWSLQGLYICARSSNNNTLCTVFDLRQQNDNTWKDVTPFPEQDAIQHDVAHAQFRSKLDMTEAYEQTHIKPEGMHKTTFSTIFSIFRAE